MAIQPLIHSRGHGDRFRDRCVGRRFGWWGMGLAILLWTVFLGGLVSADSHIVDLNSDPDPGILILNSYHAGYIWSDQEAAAIREVFWKAHPTWQLRFEMLDSKRFSEANHAEFVAEYLTRKYQGWKPSIVLLLDNPALELAAKYGSRLFPGVPMVFCGINSFRPEMLQGLQGITGICEALDIKGTLELAARLQPSAGSVVVIHDETVTGKATREMVDAALPAFQGRFNVRFLIGLSLEELLEEVGRVGSDSLILLTSYSVDKTGRAFDTARVSELLSQRSPVPIYVVHEDRLGFGALGGCLLSGVDQGREAARMALDILGGRKPGDVPVVTAPSSTPMVDARQIDRFGLSVSSLPANARVLFREESFFERHRLLVLGTLAVIFALIALVIILSINIARRCRAEAEIRQLNSELETRVLQRTTQLEGTVKELEAFSYTISHDLRGPLRTVEGFARIILEDYHDQLPADGQDALCRIRAGVERMTRLIEDLLKFSRLSRQPLARQEIDLGAMVRQVMEEVKTLYPQRTIELTMGELPPCKADPTLLRQVLFNLLENAVKYSTPKPVSQIEVGMTREGAECLYFVRDNGVGFEMKYADKLFGVFQRLHSEKEFPGTGAGLAICQRIIRRHGGRISGESVLDQGAVFRFTVPPEEL